MPDKNIPLEKLSLLNHQQPIEINRALAEMITGWDTLPGGITPLRADVLILGCSHINKQLLCRIKSLGNKWEPVKETIHPPPSPPPSEYIITHCLQVHYPRACPGNKLRVTLLAI